MLTDYIENTACVYGIYGALGGGKTLTAVEIALWALRQKYDVISNIEIDTKSSQYRYIEDVNIIDWWDLPCGAPRGSSDPHRSCIIIDECAEFFDQFSTSSPSLKNFLSWLRHSSKRGQMVFLIVQQPEFIAKSLRLIINRWIVCVDMDSFRLPVLRVKIPFCRGMVWRRVFDRWFNLVSRGWNFASKKAIGRRYNTAQSIALRGRETQFKSSYQPPSWLSMWLLRVAVAWLLIVLFWW